MRFAKAVVKHRILILILTVILMIASVFGMINTRVNYDMLTYLPSDMETVIGQNELLKDFDKGAFTFLIFEDMPNKDVAKLKEKIEAIALLYAYGYDSFEMENPRENACNFCRKIV